MFLMYMYYWEISRAPNRKTDVIFDTFNEKNRTSTSINCYVIDLLDKTKDD
jgi:hypothetical protein